MSVLVHNRLQIVFMGNLVSALRTIMIVVSAVCFFSSSFGQDISMFTQKISNGFLFNPSAAGAGPTQVLLSYRNNYSGAAGAPNNNYLSFNSSFHEGRFGVGLNLIHDKSTLLSSTYLSTAFAYHVKLGPEASLSMGISGEVNMLRLGDELLNQNNGSDVIINKYQAGVVTPDLSAGTTLRTKFFNVSVAVNHLSTSWNETGAVNEFTRYFTGSIVGLLPLKDGRSRFEPYVNYRKFFQTDQILDVGLYYNHNRMLLFGLGSRNFRMASASIGLMPLPGTFIGYSREQIFGSIGRYLGSTNEVIFRVHIRGQNSNQQKRIKDDDMDSKKLMYKVKKKPRR